MATSPSSGAREEWRQHWLVVLAGLIGVGMTSIHVYTIGPFIGPLEQEFGWKRAQISAGVSVASFIMAALSPFMGMLIDKLGPRRIALPGTLLFVAATAMLSLTTANLWVWWSLWVVVSFGGLATKPTVWTMAVASLFDKGRGLALAVTLCGTALASGVMPSVATALIDHFGWRQAYPLMALLLLVVSFPVFWFCLDSATDKIRRQPDTPMTHVARPSGVAVREALLSLRFVKIALAAFVFTIAAIGIVSNLVPILTSLHIGRAEAAAIAGLAGITSVIGRISTGYLLDRFNGNIVGGLSVAVPVISCALLLAAPGSQVVTIVAVIIIGLSLGAELDVIAYLTAQHFGTARYGTIFGTVSALWSLAVAIGPTLANYIYDQTGSYLPAIAAFLPLFLVASLSLMTLGAFPVFADEADAASAG